MPRVEPVRDFTLDLPGGWAGGYGPVGYLEALVAYARAYPACHDLVFELIDQAKAPQGLYLAADARGPYANLVVSAAAMLPVDELTTARQLDAYVAGNLASHNATPRHPTSCSWPSRPCRSSKGHISDGWSTGRTAIRGRRRTPIRHTRLPRPGGLWALEFSCEAASAQAHGANLPRESPHRFRVAEAEASGSEKAGSPAKSASEFDRVPRSRDSSKSAARCGWSTSSSWAALRIKDDRPEPSDARLLGLLIVRTGVGLDVIDALALAGFSLIVEPPTQGHPDHRPDAARARAVAGYSRYETTWLVPPELAIDIAADVLAASRRISVPCPSSWR